MSATLDVDTLYGADLDYALASALGYTITSYFVSTYTGRLEWVYVTIPGNTTSQLFAPHNHNNDLLNILTVYYGYPTHNGSTPAPYTIGPSALVVPTKSGVMSEDYWVAQPNPASGNKQSIANDMAQAALRMLIKGLTNSQTFVFPMYAEATPSIFNMSPASGTHNTSVPITVNGFNFYPDSVIKVGATSLTTTYVNSSQLTATLAAGNILTAGTYTITVSNPNGSSGPVSSNSFTFTAT